MLTNVKNENECITLVDNENKYDNQIKKRKLNIKPLENNKVSLPSSSPPQSPNSIQSFKNIVIKTPNISRILSHLSIRTPKKNTKSNVSSPLNLINALCDNIKHEPDPLHSAEIFIQTPQPSQPSSPTATSKQDQKINTIPKELFQSKFKNPKLYKKATTPKSMRSVSLNSTPTKNLKSLNLDLTLTPSKESDSAFNNYPTSPNSSFIITTPTKVKSISHFIGNDFKNNKMSSQDIPCFKNFTKEENTEENIFKYKRMDTIPIINEKIKINEYSYRDFDKISFSSLTDDSLSITSTSTSISSSSSYNFFKHHAKHYNSKKSKKILILDSKLNRTNKPTKLPLSPELSFLRLNNLYSSSIDKEEAVNKSNIDSLNITSVDVNKLYDNATLNQKIPISESLTSRSSSFLQNNLNGSSFISSIDNDIFNPKDDLKMESVSEIESMADTLPISDVSMFIDDENNNNFIPFEYQKEDNHLKNTNIHIKMNNNIELNNLNKNIDKQQEDSITFIKLNSNNNGNNDSSNDTNNDNNNSDNNNNYSNPDSTYLNNKEKVNSNKSDIYKGFVNIDGIWEDPSLSQCEARNLKDNILESDLELDEEIENSNNNQNLPTTPLMKYNENTSSTTSNSTSCYNKDSKRSLRKSNHTLLLNMDKTSSSLSLERTNSLPSLNSPLKKIFDKEEQFIENNDSNLQIKPSKSYDSTIYRRTNSLNLNLRSSSFSSSSTIVDHLNIINHPFVYEKIPSWNARKRKNLVRSNSISDINESLSSERKRSFSSLFGEEKEEEEEEEYTSDASSIKRSPSSQRILNARRKGKERSNKKSYHKHKNTEEKKINKNIILDTSSSSLLSSSVMDHQLNKDTNKIRENEKLELKGKDENISNMIDQDLMSISSEISEINPNSTIFIQEKNQRQQLQEKIKKKKEENIYENDASLLSDPTLTNLEFNKIQPKKKYENKENSPLLYNKIKEKSEGKTITLEKISSPPPILDREMIFVDEKGNVYNEQNYKYLSNYTKAVIAAELSKRYCRIPFTEILITNMPEYRQYFDENGQLKPNNYIYVEENEEDGNDKKEREEEKEEDDDDDEGEGEEEEKKKEMEKEKEKEKRKNNNTKSNDSFLDISNNIKNRHKLEENPSQQSHYFSSNINFIKNNTKTTIQFRTEPINEEKEMIFESTMSPKGKQEWLDITEASLHSTKDNFNDNFDYWDTKEKEMKDCNEEITQKNKGKYKEEDNDGNNSNEEEDENDVDFVEKIDDKITIIYRTNESKYQLVMPIKLNIYNKKDTMF